MDLLRVAWTFLWLSFLCIGGGLGIVPEIERQAVSAHQWITSREFVDAYTIAQLTPGPNMKIAAFIGYAARGPLGALVAAVAMFVPPAILTALVSQHWGRFRGLADNIALSSGMRQLMVVPSLGVESMSITPPRRAARSRMPFSPRPRPGAPPDCWRIPTPLSLT